MCIDLIADLPPISKEDFEKDYYSLQDEINAQIYRIEGSRFGVSIKDSKVLKKFKISSFLFCALMVTKRMNSSSRKEP